MNICGGLGSMNLGSGPFGSGLVGAFSYARLDSFNSISIGVTAPFFISDPATVWDLLNPDLWSINPYWPAHQVMIQWIEKVSATEIRIYTDRDMSPDSTYDIVLDITNARLTTGDSSAIYCGDAQVKTPKQSFLVLQDASGYSKGLIYDLANPFFSTDAPHGASSPLGTLQVDDMGDFENDSGLPNLKKRVLRRATSVMGDWMAMPSYGFSIEIKTKISMPEMRIIQQSAVRQILLEPDVSTCSVAVSSPEPGIVIMDIRVKDISGRSVDMTAKFNVPQG